MGSPSKTMSLQPRVRGGGEEGTQVCSEQGDVMIPEQLRHARILVVDDEETNVITLKRLLTRSGYRAVTVTTDARRAVPLFLDEEPDLVLLDLHMPHLDGFQVMDRLRGCIPHNAYVPILILTGDLDQEVRQRALSSGARDFVTKPFGVTEVLLRIRNLLETRFLHKQLARQNETLEIKVRERTFELADAQGEILTRLALAAEYRDDVTGNHAERVGLLSALIAEALGLHQDEVNLIRLAAPLHDVGKIGIPDAILMKAGALTPAEFEVMKSHTEIGARILSGSQYPVLQMAKEIARSHHEKWDGTGYTPGTARELIPQVGRIVAVADAFDTLTHERPYKPALSVDQAVGIIVEDSGTHFDPRVVDAFLRVVRDGKLRELRPISGSEEAGGDNLGPNEVVRAQRRRLAVGA